MYNECIVCVIEMGNGMFCIVQFFRISCIIKGLQDIMYYRMYERRGGLGVNGLLVVYYQWGVYIMLGLCGLLIYYWYVLQGLIVLQYYGIDLLLVLWYYSW